MADVDVGTECIPASPCDENDDENDDFLILFGEAAPLECPIPSVSWVEREVAAMDTRDRQDPQRYELSPEVILEDRRIGEPSDPDPNPRQDRTESTRRRPTRTATVSKTTTPYINFIAQASDLTASLREARERREVLRNRRMQSTTEYQQLTRRIEGLSALVQPSRPRRPRRSRRR